MNRLILALAFGLLASDVRAGWVLGTNIPSSSPLALDAGSISGPVFVNVGMSGSADANIVAWQFSLELAQLTGATGTLEFQAPATGSVTTPANYIFSGGSSLGITATNTGTQLDANDFDLSFLGGTTGNLLQIKLKASTNAAGSFGIYAREGSSNTIWSDANGGTNYFTNVPSGTGKVLIGEVVVTNKGVSVVPEPTTILQLGMGVISTLFLARRKRKTLAELPSCS